MDKTNTFDKEDAREVFLSQSFDSYTVDILMGGWRKCSNWFKFPSCNKDSPVNSPGFLTSFVRHGKSFNEICMERSALSSVINQ